MNAECELARLMDEFRVGAELCDLRDGRAVPDWNYIRGYLGADDATMARWQAEWAATGEVAGLFERRK